VLTTALADLKTIDFVYIDGNHRKQPTLDYFNQIRQYANNETVFIFDDIHWSLEMEEAWATICADESMHVTIDVFHFGIAFIRKEQVKEHFVLRW
jgi:predicted O-methyltransferase YrrM